MQGRTHIYCGDGKGKTTAAVGLAVRAAGAGKRVLFAQFMKDGGSSELSCLKALGIRLMVAPVSKFSFQMTAEEKVRCARAQEQLLRDVAEQSAGYDVVVLDELVGACGGGFVPVELAARFLLVRPQHLEVVLTGRNPDPKLLALADYVSEVGCIKHPFADGVPARKGIEF